jgi:hypothetical protein
MKQGILRVFVNVNMSQGHNALSKLAKKYEMNVSTLEPGSYLIFINGARNKIKVYAANDVIAYQRLPQGGRLDMRAIAEIPKVFNASGKMNYDDALKKFVIETMQKRAKARSPLIVYAAMKNAHLS